MLAKRIVTILPPLSFEEALECTEIHSIIGLLAANTALVTTRPFRSPHHSISDAGLIGGGSTPWPGEVSRCDTRPPSRVNGSCSVWSGRTNRGVGSSPSSTCLRRDDREDPEYRPNIGQLLSGSGLGYGQSVYTTRM